MSELSPLPSEVLPAGIRARFVSGINGLRMYILEAGSAAPGRPAVLLLHGFPELAYSWRKIMPTVADLLHHGPRRRHADGGGEGDCHLLDGAGHWVQQEQPTRVSELLLDFLKGQATRTCGMPSTSSSTTSTT